MKGDEGKGGPVGAKILIITDDVLAKRHLVKTLSHNGMRALVIPSEVGALGSYLAHCDLLVLDVPQADMGEFRLLRRIRKLTTLPIILLVNSDDYQVSIRGLDDGADHVMPKPAKDKELQARVRALLRRAHAPQQAPSWGLQPAVVQEPAPDEAPSGTPVRQ